MPHHHRPDDIFSADSTLYPPKWDLLFKAVWQYIPNPILRFVEFIPSREYRRFRKFLKLAKSVAKELVDQRTSNALEPSNRNILNVLGESQKLKKKRKENGDYILTRLVVRSSLSEDPDGRLDKDEMLSQMALVPPVDDISLFHAHYLSCTHSTMMLAGHDTVASSLSWMLFDLARHPEDQRRIRAEIASFRAKTGGIGALTATDLDAMTFTTAAIKVRNTLLCPSGLADTPHRSRYV